MLIAFPFFLAALYVPFPYAWGLIFATELGVFLNTGPSNAALANVTPPAIRASAFAVNIFLIHLLGDAISPPLIGWVSGRFGGDMNAGFLCVSAAILVSGLVWLFGAGFLGRDTVFSAHAALKCGVSRELTPLTIPPEWLMELLPELSLRRGPNRDDLLVAPASGRQLLASGVRLGRGRGGLVSTPKGPAVCVAGQSTQCFQLSNTEAGPARGTSCPAWLRQARSLFDTLHGSTPAC